MNRLIDFRRGLRRLGIGVAALLGILLLAYGVLRVPLAHWMVGELEQRLARRGISLEVGSIAPYGVLGFRVDSLLATRGQDTLAAVQRLAVALRLRAALLGRPVPAELEIDNAVFTISAASMSDSNRIGAATSRFDSEGVSRFEALSFEDKLRGGLRRLAELQAATLRLHQVHLLWHRGAPDVAFHAAIDSLTASGGAAAGSLSFNGQAWRVFMAGDTLVAASDRSQLLALPMLVEKVGLQVGARRIELRRLDISTLGGVSVKVDFRALDAQVQHRRLSRTPMFFQSLGADVRMEATDTHLDLDSASIIAINGLAWHPHLHLAIQPNGNHADTVLVAHVAGPDTTAQAYLTALTASGAFPSVKGMQAEGHWRYRADLRFDSRRPDTLAFTSAMNSRQLRIRRFGPVRPMAIADTFTHRPSGTRLRLVVDSRSPDFIPLSQVVSYVSDAILTSEDPSFRWHRGFSEQAIGESILQNYRQGRFARGGSTLSMQLVKNVFLTHEKTLARKLEEVLLVWLIEDQRLLSKDRMLEIYLNVIEWGPDVYGLSQAAYYYFDKDASALDLNEAIFLSMIIPRPRKFAWYFTPEGQPREAVARYIEMIAGLMARRKLITEEMAQIAPVLPLTLGPRAAEFVRRTFTQQTPSDLKALDEALDELDEELDEEATGAPADSTGGQR